VGERVLEKNAKQRAKKQNRQVGARLKQKAEQTVTRVNKKSVKSLEENKAERKEEEIN